MSHKTLFLNEQLYGYMLETSLRVSPVQRALYEATSVMEWAGIESSPEQVQLLQLLVRLMGAKRCLEIGVFTGCSTLGIALALPEDGFIVACDIDEERTRIAREYWERAGVSAKIRLKLAPAAQTLAEMLMQGWAGTIDFAYIDADKMNAEAYYEGVLGLLREDGLIAIDNVFWGGEAADPLARGRDALYVKALNQKIAVDDRVDITIIPIGDGLMLARKRGGEEMRKNKP